MRSVVLLRRSLLAAGLTGVSAAFFGMGSREMADDAIDSLVAVPFAAEIMAGESVDLDVLAGAVGAESGSEITIEGVSQPASGSVSVINNRIRYTSNSGFAGVDSFTYTLAAEGKSSTATIAVTVRSSISDPQTGSQGDALPPPGGSSAIPGSTGLWNPVQGINITALSPTTTHNVSNASQLATAINTINTTSAAGHHIVLANGSYSGDYTIYAQGTQANPIVIRAATLLGATLTGTLTICGRWVIVRGLRLKVCNFDRVTSPATFAATHSRMSRCLLSGASTMMRITNSASYCCFDRNEFVGGLGHVIDIRSYNERDTLYNCIVWNLFRDGGDDAATVGNATILIGSNKYEYANRPQYLLCGWNRFQNSTNSSHIQNKMGGNTIIYNTIRNMTGAFSIGSRHGMNNYIGGNYVASNSRMSVYGKGHTYAGNYVVGGIRLQPGNIPNGSLQEPTWYAETGKKGWSYAEEVKVVGNEGPFTIEPSTGTYPYAPLKNLIEAHTGSVTIASSSRQTIDRRNSPPSIVVPVAYEILASEVGPYS